jgi:ATP-binding cassette subfamily G (WHITE) protein 2 (SNQ2)
LSEGFVIFAGPIHKAKAYFEGIGFDCPARMTTPDFLTIVTDAAAREISPGYEGKVPNNAQEFHTAWINSMDYQEWIGEVKATELSSVEAAKNFQRAYVNKQATAGQSLKASYPTNFFQQLGACLTREFQLQLGNKLAMYVRLVFFGAMALIAGSVYYQLPLNGSGAFSRGGVLFFAIIFTSTSSLVEMAETINGRSTLYKHQSFHLYRSSAFYLSRVVADLPMRFLLLLVFSNLLFWLAGLGQANPGAQYGMFFLILFVCSTCFTALIRLIATFSSDLNVAQRYGGIILILLLLFNGYLIRSSVMPPWFAWIVWINPLAYGLKALLANEFGPLTFTCDGTALIPNGPSYVNVPTTYKACTIPGSTPGSSSVSGEAYLAASYGFPASISSIWIDIGAMVGFFFLYVLLAIIGVEYVKFGKGGATTNVFKRQTFLEAKQREAERGKCQDTMIVKASGMDIPSAPPFTWTNLRYTVPVKGGEALLLNNVNGRVISGRMVALMGSSGAGKTTLLDVLALRKTIGKIEGDRMVGCKPQDDSFRRMIGYAEQMDVHMTTATVREALRFSANLRQPADIPQTEKYRYVEEVIHLLEMDSIADAMVGTIETGLGLSMEERKRLTIGVELAAKPQILFLDEPTSGLDSNAAANLVRLIRNLADHNQAVICTIHQPSSSLFEAFDDLLLLARGGKTVYFGPVGDGSGTIKEYFERYGAPPLGADANPAEWILDFAAGKKGTEQFDWANVWLESPECQQRLAEIQSLRQQSQAKGLEAKAPTAMGEWERTALVMKRAFVNYWRLGDYNFGRVVLQIVIGLILGLSFWQVQPTLAGMQSMMFALFQTSTLGVVLIQSVQPQWFAERPYFFREASAGLYSWWSWTLATVTADIPYILLGSTIFFCIFYYMTGLNPASDRAAFFWFTYSIFCLFAASLGQMLSAFSPVLAVAQLITPIMASIFSLFAGVYFFRGD